MVTKSNKIKYFLLICFLILGFFLMCNQAKAIREAPIPSSSSSTSTQNSMPQNTGEESVRKPATESQIPTQVSLPTNVQTNETKLFSLTNKWMLLIATIIIFILLILIILIFLKKR